MKIKNILWGILFLAAAAFIVLSGMGYIYNVGIVRIIFTVIFAGIIITSIFDVNFVGILFPAAFICILFDKEIGIENLTPWPVLAIALLGSIGLSLIFRKGTYRSHKKAWERHRNSDQTNSDFEHKEYKDETIIDDDDDSVVECSVKMGGTVKYVNSQNFEKAYLSCTMGSLTVYFDNTKIPSGNAIITVEAKLGGMELFIPREWNVKINANTSLGGIDEKNKNRSLTDGPTVTINGNVTLAGVDIKYI